MPTLKQIVLVLLIVVCLGAAGGVQVVVDLHRAQLNQLSIRGDTADPQITLITHLLGGFRGLLVDAVWLRAVKLQQANKFWELYQLYVWMGKLEPRLEEVWDFNGWNMSYNLVAELPDSEARWQWIARSISWLRDEGLKYNPRSAKIMERIAWIYFHKIGRDLDLHHYYYKHRWALIMHSVLGDREQQNIPAMAELPEKLEDLLKDKDVAAALAGLDLNPQNEAFKSIDRMQGLHQVPAPIGEALRRNRNKAGMDKLRNWISAHILRTQYKMTRFDIMKAMEEKYGKFDWRLPEAHAIYWSTLAQATDPNSSRRIDYDRILMYSIQETMRRGQIAYMGPDPAEPMVTSFDLSKVSALDRLYEEMLAKYDIHREDRGAESVRDGHVQFLQEVTFDLYFAGYTAEALKYHRRLKELYDKPQPYIPMEEYVLGRVKGLVDEFGTHAKVRAFIDGLIFRTCFFLVTNKLDEARKFEGLARSAWIAYCDYTEAQAQGRIRVPRAALPPFEIVMRDNVRSILLGRTEFPAYMIPALRAILKVPEGAEVEKVEVGTGLVQQIPPSSPPPK